MITGVDLMDAKIINLKPLPYQHQSLQLVELVSRSVLSITE